MPVCFAALMCHAPIVVPAVGGDRAAQCASTTRAMTEIARRAVGSQPDRLVLVSPHSPRHPTRWGLWSGRHRGDLGGFGAPGVATDLPDDPALGAAFDFEPIAPDRLDHGAMVPLAFLAEAGWRGPTSIVAWPWDEDPDCGELGRAIAGLPGRTALIASGDMSHRLKPGAPSGFDPRAQRFDDAFVAGLRAQDWAAAIQAEQRAVAAEDVIVSTKLAMASVDGPRHAEVLSYEGPWGVGYTEAILFDPEPAAYAVARCAVRAAAEGRGYSPEGGGPGAAVFVTLMKNGRLRGCIGSTEPVHGSLHACLAWAGEAAARRDPRFPAVTPDEVDDLHVEVSVLQPPEPIDGPEQLDPSVYGVVVTSGGRRGLLLPDLDGVDTVAKQVSIARRKGGIGEGEPVELQRFTVQKLAMP